MNKKEVKRENNIKSNKSKILNVFFSFIIILLIFICIFLGIKLKNASININETKQNEIVSNNSFKTEQIYNRNIEIYEKEKIKYDKILKEDSINDIYNYFYANIMDGNIYPTKVMEYIFYTLYPKATEEEKFDLFFIFYLNQTNLEQLYYTFLNEDLVLDFFNVEYNGYDWTKFEDLDKITRTDITNMLVSMMSNDLYFVNNYPEMKVNYDWNIFLEKYSDLLDEEYIRFIKLDRESDDLIINPNMTNYNTLSSIWYLHSYETFIKEVDNYALRTCAQQIYEQNLALFLGQYAYDGQAFYSDEETQTVNENFIAAYETYIELYPDDETSVLLSRVLDICYEFSGKGNIDIVKDLNSLCYDFINDAEWLPLEASDEGMGLQSETITEIQ